MAQRKVQTPGVGRDGVIVRPNWPKASKGWPGTRKKPTRQQIMRKMQGGSMGGILPVVTPVPAGNILVPFTDASWIEQDADNTLFVDADFDLRLFNAVPAGNNPVMFLKRDYGASFFNADSRLRFKFEQVGRTAGFSGPLYTFGFSPLDESPQLLGANPKVYIQVTVYRAPPASDTWSLSVNNWDGVATFNNCFIGWAAGEYAWNDSFWIEIFFDVTGSTMTANVYSDAFTTLIGTDSDPLAGFDFQYFYGFDAVIAGAYILGLNNEDYRMTEFEMVNT